MIAIKRNMVDGKAEEIILGSTKYLHKADEKRDYLIDNSGNEIKINISFSKDPEKNKKAKDGLKSFFNELYS